VVQGLRENKDLNKKINNTGLLFNIEGHKEYFSLCT